MESEKLSVVHFFKGMFELKLKIRFREERECMSDYEVSCMCVSPHVCACISAFILYNFFSSELYSSIISQILCNAGYARICLLTASLSYVMFFSFSLSLSESNYLFSIGGII